MGPEFRYRAFISYSHSDERWAGWLHRALETYRLPRHVAGRETVFGPVPERLAPVFRDREELATATNLGETLTRALTESAALVVICSPAAARSRWVNEEILTFKRLGREDRIFCLIVAGEPGASVRPGTTDEECFPNALIYRMGPDGELSGERSEPIAADVRPGKDSRNDARLKLVAGLVGVSLDELKQREAQRRQRRAMLLVAASLAGMAVTSTLATAAWLARNEAERQRVRAEAEAEAARQTTSFIVDLFKLWDPSEALGNTITAREILDRGASRIERELGDQPAIQATLMDTLGTVYTSLGLYDPAARLVREAVHQATGPVRRAAPGGGEQPRAPRRGADAEGRVRRVRGQPALRARGAARRAGRAVARGRADPDAARGRAVTAGALRGRRACDPRGAVDPTCAARREAPGRRGQHRGARVSATTTAASTRTAVSDLRLALDMRRELHPQGHPLLAQAMGNLAWVLMDQGAARGGRAAASRGTHDEAPTVRCGASGDRHLPQQPRLRARAARATTTGPASRISRRWT